ncbi:hypothetical protein [Shimazuella kribbensis]|uniref:hypothetical protein n=1 Tax=Shimazuella kribbensis TaxID=139808 RepID=UPI0012EBEE7A|nr:hypothetical protein [Shimazuella kribbensis]
MPNRDKKSIQQLWENHISIRLVMSALLIGFGNFLWYMKQEVFITEHHLALSLIAGIVLIPSFEMMRNKKVNTKSGEGPSESLIKVLGRTLYTLFLFAAILVMLDILFNRI